MLVDENKDLSLASFVRPPEVVYFSIVIGVPRGWLKTSYRKRSLRVKSVFCLVAVISKTKITGFVPVIATRMSVFCLPLDGVNFPPRRNITRLLVKRSKFLLPFSCCPVPTIALVRFE